MFCFSWCWLDGWKLVIIYFRKRIKRLSRDKNCKIRTFLLKREKCETYCCFLKHPKKSYYLACIFKCSPAHKKRLNKIHKSPFSGVVVCERTKGVKILGLIVRQTDRQTDRHTDRHSHTYGQRDLLHNTSQVWAGVKSEKHWQNVI